MTTIYNLIEQKQDQDKTYHCWLFSWFQQLQSQLLLVADDWMNDQMVEKLVDVEQLDGWLVVLMVGDEQVGMVLFQVWFLFWKWRIFKRKIHKYRRFKKIASRGWEAWVLQQAKNLCIQLRYIIQTDMFFLFAQCHMYF